MHNDTIIRNSPTGPTEIGAPLVATAAAAAATATAAAAATAIDAALIGEINSSLSKLSEQGHCCYPLSSIDSIVNCHSENASEFIIQTTALGKINTLLSSLLKMLPSHEGKRGLFANKNQWSTTLVEIEAQMNIYDKDVLSSMPDTMTRVSKS